MALAPSYSELMIGSRTRSVVTTRAADDRSLSTRQSLSEEKVWQKWIDELLRWRENPAILESDEGVATSPVTIESAIAMVWRLSKSDTPTPAPAAIVPDGDGGIAIHFRRGELEWSVELLASGHAEMYTFAKGVLISSDHLV